MRSSVDRDREKSQSDERSVSHLAFQPGAKGKVVIEVDPKEVWEKEAALTSLGYQLRPKFGERFSKEQVHALIESLLLEFFGERKEYDHDKAQEWVETLAKQLNSRVRQLPMPKYRFVTNVVLGERIGGGVHAGMKCYWDGETDMHASYTYLGVSYC